MKIAMPYKNGKINGQFGASDEFIVLDAENFTIKHKKVIPNRAENFPRGLPQQLKEEGVEVIIAAGMGRPMQEVLFYEGFHVILGASGEVEKLALDFLKGQLTSKPSTCACGGHHDDEDEDEDYVD